jgi:hypothetical protein
MNDTKIHAGVWATAALALGTTGCRAIGAIFKVGVWAGIIAVAFLVLVGFAVSRLFARG